MIEKNQALFLNKAWPTTQTQNKTRQNYYSIILSMHIIKKHLYDQIIFTYDQANQVIWYKNNQMI